MQRRVIVIGGSGYFGAVAVKLLREEGLAPLVASRRSGADLVLDVEDRQSLQRVLRRGDVVLDAAGPFQKRGTALIEAAMEIGCDVVDIADSLAYVRRVAELEDRIVGAGIRVLTACSSVSAISAAAMRLSGVDQPVRLSGCLVPATRYTAVKGTAESMFASVGRPVEVFTGGTLATRPGWQSSRTFRLPPPLGRRSGYLFEAADAWTLPRRWPSLKQVDWYVDTNVAALNTILRLAAAFPPLRWLIGHAQPLGLKLSRWLGCRRSGVAYEIADAHGGSMLVAFTSPECGYLIPVAPAVLAVRALVKERMSKSGLIPPDEQIDPRELVGYVEAHAIQVTITPGERRNRTG